MKKQDTSLVASVSGASNQNQIVLAPSDLLNEREVATMLGIAAGTLRNWRSRRIGVPFAKIGKRACRYRRADVDAFIASGMAQVEAA